MAQFEKLSFFSGGNFKEIFKKNVIILNVSTRWKRGRALIETSAFLGLTGKKEKLILFCNFLHNVYSALNVF